MALLYISFFIIGLSQFMADAMHGGEIDKIERYPYMAQVNHFFDTGDVDFCGAAILSEKWILTAGHCMHGSEDEGFLRTEVRVGTDETLTGGKLYKTARTVVHKDYSWDTRWNNDISLIELAEPIVFNNKIQPIPIAKESPKPGNQVTMTGYGNDKDESVSYLKAGRQAVITRKKCKNAYREANHEAYRDNIMFDDRTFCVDSSAVDAGHGDSGGPTVLNGRIVGVIAEGNESPIPNVNVNVARYYSWIADTTGISFD